MHTQPVCWVARHTASLRNPQKSCNVFDAGVLLLWVAGERTRADGAGSRVKFGEIEARLTRP